MSEDLSVPKPGQWPTDPQEDVPIVDDRLWVDGCFDFAHHGHAGAILQARKLGNDLYVGVHSDEAILHNKGPTVMNLYERVIAVEGCRWVTKIIPHAPYVTSLPWISHYGCKYVVHGDDITADISGEDCYRFVKAAGRFKVVKRTPGISTTDLVGRMLLCTRSHFIHSFEKVLAGEQGPGDEKERQKVAEEIKKKLHDYASDESGLMPGVEVWTWRPENTRLKRALTYPAKEHQGPKHERHSKNDKGVFRKLVSGKCPRKGQRIIYVDGGFDLFSSGHMEFLKCVTTAEENMARDKGWFNEEAKADRRAICGYDYSPIYLIAGIHEDEVINHWKGLNHPIMNIFERGLCVLQCKYIHSVILGVPFTPSKPFLEACPHGQPHAVYHGPTAFMPLDYDPYDDAKSLGMFKEITQHKYQHVNAGEIVERILKSRALYEERQKAKGVKGIGEEQVRRRQEQRMKAKRSESFREVEKMFGV